MIRVTIEFIPHGNEKETEHVGTAIIYNDKTGTSVLGNYKAFFSKKAKIITKADVTKEVSSPTSIKSIWKKTKVTAFRRQRHTFWDLLLVCLYAALADRNRQYLRRIGG